MLLWTSRSKHMGTKENCYFGLQVSVPNLNSLCTPYTSFYLSIEAWFLKFIYLFCYLPIFTDKKSLDVIIVPIIWLLKFFLSCFHLVFLPTSLTSLPPGVMLLNRSTTPRDNATDIKKDPEKMC